MCPKVHLRREWIRCCGDSLLKSAVISVHGQIVAIANLEAGPDGVYLKDADNERIASSIMAVDFAGWNENNKESGDDDSDGLLWSAAPGAANRIWETTA